jgi:hypothetical protein
MSKVAVGSLARCAQRLNGVKSFFVGVVVSTKRAPRPYRLGKKQVNTEPHRSTCQTLPHQKCTPSACMAPAPSTHTHPSPFSLWQVDLNLQLRTSVGMKLTGLNELSNEPPTDIELERFRVPLAPAEVRPFPHARPTLALGPTCLPHKGQRVGLAAVPLPPRPRHSPSAHAPTLATNLNRSPTLNYPPGAPQASRDPSPHVRAL